MRFDLRDAAWLNSTRMRDYALMLLLGYAICVAVLYMTSNGLVDRSGKPLGSDFANVWTAGLRVLQGAPELAFDPAQHKAIQNAVFNQPGGDYFGWHYPPMFLAIAALLACLPYLPALVVWQLTTLPAYLWVIRGIVPHKLAVLLALAFPAVLVNLLHGHNGFLTAALLGGGLLLLPTRPAMAGMLLGLLAYKPQFAIVIPVALLAAQQWRAIAAAAATVIASFLLSWLAFGTDAWLAFFSFSEFTRTVVLEQGATGWEKIQSAFSAVRQQGGSIKAAYAVQGVVTLLVVAGIFALWRSRADHHLKSAALCVAVLLATPYALDYDMMVLGPAVAFFAARGLEKGFAPYDKSVLAFVWIVPFLARGISGALLVPIGFLTLAAFFALCVSRGLGPRQSPEQLATA
jgi:alpha-1,2-mannosyltransferase